MNRCFKWAVREVRHVFPVFLFFFIAFNIINWMEAFLLKRSGLQPYSVLTIAIAAALVAKIFLVIDHLPIEAPVRKKPLAYVVLWKTFLYWLITLAVRLAIRVWPYLFLKQRKMAELKEFFAQIDWQLFIAVQSWYLVLLFLYVVFHELARVIGWEKMRRLFFGK